jgi:two-component system, OmpR family, response regulator PhoP
MLLISPNDSALRKGLPIRYIRSGARGGQHSRFGASIFTNQQEELRLLQPSLRSERITIGEGCQAILGGCRRNCHSIHIMRALVIEDERRLAENIARGLRQSGGFAVDVAPDGDEGLFLIQECAYDVIVLDLMLPRRSGEEILDSLRSQGSEIPVLVLTAKEGKASIIALLNAGADDYLAKPFDMGELVARAKAAIRRNKGHAKSRLSFDTLELDIATRMVRRGGHLLELTPMEYRVIEYLMLRVGRVVSKTELLEHLYDYNWEKFSNVIEVYMSGLRRKVDGQGSPKLLHTVRGHGYLLDTREGS